MLKSDESAIHDGRKNKLKDTDELEVVVPLREQVVNKLVDKLEELGEGQNTVELWNRGNADRSEQLLKQQVLLEQFDEFMEPIYKPAQEWSSTLHLPIVYTVCKTYHARMLAALLGVDPPLTVKARQGHNVDRAMLIQELMRYTLSSWSNGHKGIEEAADSWIWSWITAGEGFLKGRWDKKYTRFVDVVEEEETVGSAMAPMFSEDGGAEILPIKTTAKKEVERTVTEVVFDGPMLEFKPREDILVIGGGGDPQDADEVIEQDYLTASQLWQLADQKIFRDSIVRKVIEGGEQLKSAEQVNAIKVQQATSSGGQPLDVTTDAKRYQVLERYAKIDVDGSGIASDVILWVHVGTGEILRATYLRRAMRTGLIPYFRIEFHRRHNQAAVGLPELLYTLQREIDAMHNMKVDFGLISSMPFGFYRATSSIAQEKMPLEPGVLIPVDNPQTDVYFPQLGNRASFTAQEEQMLYGQIERMTSISDISLGIVGGQGAARTATGARALLGESNANLDVYLRRMNRGWRRALTYMFHLLQERMPDGFQFRLLGDDGSYYWETVKSKEEIAGSYDFELEGNSANSNKQIQMEQANNVFATVMNPLLIQLGIAGPIEIYNALRAKLQVEGVKDFSRFIRKPQGQDRLYTPEEIANATLSGVEIRLTPQQDLQGFIDFFEHIFAHDELLGQFNEGQTIALAKKAAEAGAMLQAAQQQAGQVANAQQVEANAALTTAPQSAAPQPAGTGQAPA